MQEELQSVKQRFGIIGNSPLLNHSISVAVQVAPTDMSVLITGESGTGKESFSKIIHQLSKRKHGKFIAVNCGAIPEGTIDSELFGHEKGAFTGAHDARKGYFEETDGGTIFLDEIGEMPMGTQARLLRVLEYGQYIRVGSSKVQKTDVRVVAATNVNLQKAIENGKFREDLYYRLSTVPIYVPPLRDRGEDVLLLFRKFATDFSEKYRTKPVKLSEEAKQHFLKFRFPGNIRQLKNIAEQMSVLEEEREIRPEVLFKYLPEGERNALPALSGFGKSKSEESNFSEREILYKVLFEMKRDMTELKKLVFESLHHTGAGAHLIKDHKEFFSEFDRSDASDNMHKVSEEKSLPETVRNNYAGNTGRSSTPTIIELQDEEDFQLEQEPHTLLIQDKEKELIIRALQKNKNKRKYAALDLGISERTLYRKLKQYDLEDEKF